MVRSCSTIRVLRIVLGEALQSVQSRARRADSRRDLSAQHDAINMICRPSMMPSIAATGRSGRKWRRKKPPRRRPSLLLLPRRLLQQVVHRPVAAAAAAEAVFPALVSRACSHCVVKWAVQRRCLMLACASCRCLICTQPVLC